MRFKSVYISEYKNLKNFTMAFDGSSFIDVFVGKNGTGKSNFFEALIKIFQHLYEFDNKIKPIIEFDYEIIYKIDDENTKIAWKSGRLTINDDKKNRVGKTPLPDNLLIYYSGHNTNVDESSRKFQLGIKKHIRGGEYVNFHRFMYFDRGYKKLLLTILLTQSFDENLSKIIKKRLNIKDIGKEFVITLRKPYLVSRNYIIDRADDKTLYWGMKGEPREFLRRLSTCNNAGLRESGYFIKKDKKPAYIYFIDIEKFRNEFKYDSVDKLIELFNSIKITSMIDDIKFEIILSNDQRQDVNNFSDGQFQSIYLYSLLEAFQDRTCITLLDEPDSFLHPEWQYDFLKQTKNVSEASTRKNHVLMSSHSPSTIAAIDNERLRSFEIENNSVISKSSDKSRIIQTLSAGLIAFSEKEARLNIHHVLNSTSRAILFTEGVTDEIILETAWTKLYPGKTRKFEIQNAFSCSFLRILMKDEEMYRKYKDRTFFALFDFDEAHKDWNQLGTEIQSDPCKCLTRKHPSHEAYSMLLPVPANPLISKQVINSKNGKNYGKNSLLTIELLFYGVPSLKRYFVVDIDRTDGFIKFINDNQKTEFAKEIVPTIDASHFRVFLPIFEFIKSKCSSTPKRV